LITSNLCGGFLSGKYLRGEGPPQGSRIAAAPDEFEEAWTKRNVERNWRTLDVVGEISEETGRSYAQIALNWLLRQEGVTAPIIGARGLEQLEDNLGAAGWELSPEQVARLDRASAIEDIYPYRMIREMQQV
jgi:aryl-alcohol dehydrogenase-like predicted oxidoreductase